MKNLLKKGMSWLFLLFTKSFWFLYLITIIVFICWLSNCYGKSKKIDPYEKFEKITIPTDVIRIYKDSILTYENSINTCKDIIGFRKDSIRDKTGNGKKLNFEISLDKKEISKHEERIIFLQKEIKSDSIKLSHYLDSIK